MGTGTAFVRATKKEILHIRGTGVGSGTLIALSSIMLNKNDMGAILAMAEIGQRYINHDIPSLSANLPASNFGKIKSTANEAVYATAIGAAFSSIEYPNV